VKVDHIVPAYGRQTVRERGVVTSRDPFFQAKLWT